MLLMKVWMVPLVFGTENLKSILPRSQLKCGVQHTFSLSFWLFDLRWALAQRTRQHCCFLLEEQTFKLHFLMQQHSAGRYTGSYRIPVFIFLTILIFKIPQYRCHLNNVWNATLLERGHFSLLYFGEDTAVCVTKRESSETEALVECDEREVIHNIRIDRHKYPPSAASAPASLTN